MVSGQFCDSQRRGAVGVSVNLGGMNRFRARLLDDQ